MNSIIKKPTIKDVAKQSNVSVATVSRILNGLNGYSEETRKRVLKVVDEIDYERNAIARNLKIKETRTIGVFYPKVTTSFYIEILNGIEDYAHVNNYSVIICNVGIDGNRAIEYFNILSERQVDGLIVCSLPLKEDLIKKTIKSHIPCILVSTLSNSFPLEYVKVDDYRAAYGATSYLIENGHKNIAMLSGSKSDIISGLPRINGFIQALKDNNIILRENLIKCNGFGFKEGIKSMEELLQEKEKVTAIFAASDDIAIGALSVAHKRKIKVPEDISIIGYDNTNVAEMCYPPLTTIAQPLYEMGRKSMELLLKKITTNKNIESIIMPYEIVERDTVKKIQ